MNDRTDHCKDRVISNLNGACDTMQDAVDEARRAIKTGNTFAAQQVLSKLAWGFANASNKIEAAFGAVEDGYDVRIHDLQSQSATSTSGAEQI